MKERIYDIEFERSKIYEKLEYLPQPENYSGKLPWAVQQQIAATNGIQYVDRIGKLKDYPTYELPVNKVETGLMLDIGTGWGRWLVAGAAKGYIPVGIDLRLEFCQTARQTLQAAGKNGYTVVADLKEIPFKENLFDLVWSFSVIQHTHKDRVLNCLAHIQRILAPGGFTKLEFPNKNGFRNKRGPVKQFAAKADDYNSWVVRYYTPDDYKNIFNGIFGNFKYTNHSFLGIGVLKEDLKYVSAKNKLLCGISLAGSLLTKVITPLKKLADSIYIEATKQQVNLINDSLQDFYKAHAQNPADNLNIVYLLQCPVSGKSLTLSEDKSFVITSDGMIKYPVIDGIPILIRSEIISA